MKLSIIIPVYNEEKTIAEVIKRVYDCALPPKVIRQVIVVDDASSDKTLQQLAKVSKLDLILLSHKANKGKGAAIRTGLKKADGDYIIIQDADLEYHPEDFKKLLEKALDEKAEVVYGTRLVNYPLRLWGRNKTVMPSHLLGNHFLTMLTNLLYDSKLTDMETCYKLISKKALQGITLESDKFEIEPEITAKLLKKGIEIREVPIKIKPRTHKEGKKIKWTDGFGAVWTLIKYRFTN